jgi:hypothetical protein
MPEVNRAILLDSASQNGNARLCCSASDRSPFSQLLAAFFFPQVRKRCVLVMKACSCDFIYTYVLISRGPCPCENVLELQRARKCRGKGRPSPMFFAAKSRARPICFLMYLGRCCLVCIITFLSPISALPVTPCLSSLPLFLPLAHLSPALLPLYQQRAKFRGGNS